MVRDVIEDKVTVEGARRDYRVVIDALLLQVDHTATASLWAWLRKEVIRRA